LVTDLFETTHEVLIAGSGPAGLTAAIYAARANLNPVMVEGEAAGGQLVDTTDVENYPGFPDGILGPELIDVMKKQAERFGTRILTDHIESCDLSKRPFTVRLQSGKTLTAQTLIISTGASARWLGIESETKLKGHGVTACATCDGFFFKGKEVAVIGGGDTAMEEATFLTKFCTKVTVIHRRGELRASKIMQDRAFNNPKIEFKWNSVVEEVYDVSQNKVTGLKLRNTSDNSTEDFKCEGLFLAIGHDPNTGFLDGQIGIDEHGFVVVQHPTTKTSVPGVFACGDVMDPVYKQAVTAAGTGCRAAIDAERFLEAEKG
jgi:thioredoxin reductase (NADPH)